LFFHGDTRRDYLILNQPAANRRPGGWSVRSLSEVPQSDALDLRKAKDAAKLEKALSALS
jgi:hypothetical protein